MNGLARPARILVADDDALAAAFTMQLLAIEQDLLVAGVVRDVAELEAAAADLVVAEVTLSGRDLAPAIGHLSMPVLVLSHVAGSAAVLGLIAAGARGYLLKDAAPRRLAQSVRACLADGSVLDERLTDVVFQGYRDATLGGGRQGALGLQLRARQVLGLMAGGLRNREIGQRLGLSEHTVKVYAAQVFAYFGVSDRTAAVLEATRRGMLS